MSLPTFLRIYSSTYFFVFVRILFSYASLYAIFYMYLLILKHFLEYIHTSLFFGVFVYFPTDLLKYLQILLFSQVFLCFSPHLFVFAWIYLFRYFLCIYLKFINIHKFQEPPIQNLLWPPKYTILVGIKQVPTFFICINLPSILKSTSPLEKVWLTLSWRRSLPYRNQSIDWFLYVRDFRHERVNSH